jgi:hypothetical protein
MTAKEIISACIVPDTKTVFVLGCFERRVTVLAQQIRALNLADALISEEYVRSGRRIAVIGGGAAGVTFANAIALECPSVKAIDLFEAKSDLLHLQLNGRDRFIHPHLYDWPAMGSDQKDAGLPILNWSASTANLVAQTILKSFDADKRRFENLNVYKGRAVKSITPLKYAGCTIGVEGDKNGEHYDVVVLAIGFGYERCLGEGLYSYWGTSILAGGITTANEEEIFFVSGNGDGGLVDFAMAALKGHAHEAVISKVANFDGLVEVKKKLLEIEAAAWAAGDSFNIFEAYCAELPPFLPSDLFLRIHEEFRPGAKIVLHTNEKSLFRRDTSILNRFTAFCIIVADENAGSERIKLIIGKEFKGTVPTSGPILIHGEPQIDGARRFLRLGANREVAFEPFKVLAEKFRATHPGISLEYKPATPQLSAAARARFSKHTIPQTPSSTTSISVAQEDILEDLHGNSEAQQQQRREILESALDTASSEALDLKQVHPPKGKTIAQFTPSLAYVGSDHAIKVRYKAFKFGATEPLLVEAIDRTVAPASTVMPKEILQSEALDVVGKSIEELQQYVRLSAKDLHDKIIIALKSLEVTKAIEAASQLESYLNQNLSYFDGEQAAELYYVLAKIEVMRIETNSGEIVEEAKRRAKHFLEKARHVRS